MHLGHDMKSLMKWLHALLFVALPPQMFLVLSWVQSLHSIFILFKTFAIFYRV